MRSTAAATSAYSFGRSTPAVFDHDAAVDHHGVDIRRLAAIDQVRDQVVDRLQVGFLQVDDDQVGQRPGADDAQLTLRIAHGAGAVDRSQLQRLVGRECHGIARGGFLQEGCRAQLLEHVEVVVRAGAVGADGHQRTRGPHLLDGSHAARNLHVALRVVRHGHPPLGQRADVAVGDMDAVCADGLVVEHTQRIEVLDGCRGVFFAHDTHLVPRLGDMGHEMQPPFAGQLLAAPQVFGRHGIGRMGCEGNLYTVAVSSQRNGLLRLGQHLVDIVVEIVAAQHRADAQPPGDLHAAVLVVIHVHERGDAAQEHLDDAERHAQRHVVGRLARLERPYIVVEPLHQGDRRHSCVAASWPHGNAYSQGPASGAGPCSR